MNRFISQVAHASFATMDGLVRRSRLHGPKVAHERGPAATMSWHAYAFDTYKRARMAIYPTDLQRLRCPCEHGLVSVVLPLHNGPDLLVETLHSILAQTYATFELIAIDDGSADETRAILDRYAAQDTRIRVIHQECRDLPDALSHGCRLAHGEF